MLYAFLLTQFLLTNCMTFNLYYIVTVFISRNSLFMAGFFLGIIGT
jgi:hypothetical protein